MTIAQDDVVGACRRAAESSGKHASFKSAVNKLTLTAPTVGGQVTGSKKQRQLGTVDINLKGGEDGGTHLEAKIGRYVTRQSKILERTLFVGPPAMCVMVALLSTLRPRSDRSGGW